MQSSCTWNNWKEIAVRRLRNLTDEALIFKLETGKTYGGRLEEYQGGDIIELYSCHRLGKKNLGWLDSDGNIEHGGGIFRLSQIAEIFHLPKAQIEAIQELEDVLQIYIDPYYRPMVGIKCILTGGNRGDNWKHEPDCDFGLHDALDFISTYRSNRMSKRQSRQFED